MNITYDTFLRFCPSATTPDDTLFDNLAGFISDAEERLTSIVGEPMTEKLAGSEYDLVSAPVDRSEKVMRLMAQWVCLTAYYDAVPHLDLVLTATGFGVVSNANVAPASEHRVNALSQRLKRHAIECRLRLIDELRHFKEWNELPIASELIDSLFWKKEHMRYLGYLEPTVSDFLDNRPECLHHEKELRNIVSTEFFDELCAAERTASASKLQCRVVTLCRQWIASCCRHDGSNNTVKRALLSFLDSNIDQFPTYKNSSNYEANHFKPYENQKDDTCFFLL